MSRSSAYRPEMPGEMIDYFAAGALPSEIPGKLGVRKEDVIRWLRDLRKPEFKDAFKVGMASSEAYWARMAMDALMGGLGKGFKEKLYLYVMESQFGWKKEGIDVEKVERENVLSDDELDKRIEELLGSPASNVVPMVTEIKKKRKRA